MSEHICNRCGHKEYQHNGVEKFCPFYSTFRAASPSAAPAVGKTSTAEDIRNIDTVLRKVIVRLAVLADIHEQNGDDEKAVSEDHLRQDVATIADSLAIQHVAGKWDTLKADARRLSAEPATPVISLLTIDRLADWNYAVFCEGIDGALALGDTPEDAVKSLVQKALAYHAASPPPSAAGSVTAEMRQAVRNAPGCGVCHSVLDEDAPWTDCDVCLDLALTAALTAHKEGAK